MAKFFNKDYKHAFKRGSKVWVSGKIKGQSYHRMSTAKGFSKANMNYVENHWEEILEEYFEQKNMLMERKRMLTLRDFLPRSLELRTETASEGTIRDYELSIRKHILPVFGDCKFDEITISKIKDWQKYLRVEVKLSQKTIIGIRAMFSGILNHAIEEGIATTNVISQTKAPDKKLFVQYDEFGNLLDHKGREIEDKILDPFTLDDVLRLIDAAEGQFKLILTVLFFTGMRTGEMVTLKWSDIDWSSETIHIQRANNSSHKIGTTKNGTTRKITILPIVMDALKKQYKVTGLKGGFIFLAQDGGRYTTYDTFRKHHWKNLLLRLGYDYRKFYQTRHTFASIMLSNGEDIIWVSKVMLGHSEVATTYKFYAKYIQPKNKKHATFLDDERTNNVQNINLKSESA